MNEKEIILSFEELTLAYGSRIVLQNVDFSIRKGEFWFFIGPNGEGKTTLLKSVLGEIKPKEGNLLFGRGAEKREDLSFIPQHCDLNPTLPTTVGEFASLGFTGIKLSRKERSRRLAHSLERVGLQGMEGIDYWTLSGGQKQRVLVARALVRRPTLLILDEPTKGIDLSTEDRFLQFLSSLNKEEELTVILVAHDLNIAARYGTHAALFSKGSVLAGTSAEVLTADTLQEAYGIRINVGRGISGPIGIHIEGGCNI